MKKLFHYRVEDDREFAFQCWADGDCPGTVAELAAEDWEDNHHTKGRGSGWSRVFDIYDDASVWLGRFDVAYAGDPYRATRVR